MKYELKEILSLALDIAERMIKCGAEVSRVEDSMRIIFRGYNVKYYEVYAINSLILATLRSDDDVVTECRRVRYLDNDFLQLELVNDLSRSIVVKNKSRKEVMKELKKIKQKKNPLLLYLGEILAAFSFTLFFGGMFVDGLCSLIVSSILFLIDYFIPTKKINKMIYNFLASFIIGITSIFFYKLFTFINYDKVIIGNIMLLIPGLSMFISVYDIVKGDTVSGASRFIDGIFLALSISAGIALSLLLGGIL